MVQSRYNKDELTALESVSKAQEIAFAPIIFQAALNLRNKGILKCIDDGPIKGMSLQDIQKTILSLNEYAISVLIDIGLSAKIIYISSKVNDEHFYRLTKVGHFLLNDKMTRVNMDFVQDVCYEGAFYLNDALTTGKPSGLKVFGTWPTIYPALSQLPPKAKESWFAFDHFYSDGAFEAVLPHLFRLKPAKIFDIGGNTGKFSIACANFNPDVHITILDLPEQISLALMNIHEKQLADRISVYPIDLLSQASLPEGADIWWMSQFLDCFSECEIVDILTKIASKMKPNSYVCILELFWDQQRFEAASLSLNATSLYFTLMANGNSRFYHSDKFMACIDRAGLKVNEQIDGLGLGHTLLICQKA